jgi:hypothetical protein
MTYNSKLNSQLEEVFGCFEKRVLKGYDTYNTHEDDMFKAYLLCVV